MSSASTFEGHSEASDVLRELFKIIQVLLACQVEWQSFLIAFTIPFSVRTAQKIKITRRPTSGRGALSS
jgi:hypothetical protein